LIALALAKPNLKDIEKRAQTVLAHVDKFEHNGDHEYTDMMDALDHGNLGGLKGILKADRKNEQQGSGFTDPESMMQVTDEPSDKPKKDRSGENALKDAEHKIEDDTAALMNQHKHNREQMHKDDADRDAAHHKQFEDEQKAVDDDVADEHRRERAKMRPDDESFMQDANNDLVIEKMQERIKSMKADSSRMKAAMSVGQSTPSLMEQQNSDPLERADEYQKQLDAGKSRMDDELEAVKDGKNPWVGTSSFVETEPKKMSDEDEMKQLKAEMSTYNKKIATEEKTLDFDFGGKKSDKVDPDAEAPKKTFMDSLIQEDETETLLPEDLAVLDKQSTMAADNAWSKLDNKIREADVHWKNMMKKSREDVESSFVEEGVTPEEHDKRFHDKLKEIAAETDKANHDIVGALRDEEKSVASIKDPYSLLETKSGLSHVPGLKAERQRMKLMDEEFKKKEDAMHTRQAQTAEKLRRLHDTFKRFEKAAEDPNSSAKDEIAAMADPADQPSSFLQTKDFPSASKRELASDLLAHKALDRKIEMKIAAEKHFGQQQKDEFNEDQQKIADEEMHDAEQESTDLKPPSFVEESPEDRTVAAQDNLDHTLADLEDRTHEKHKQAEKMREANQRREAKAAAANDLQSLAQMGEDPLSTQWSKKAHTRVNNIDADPLMMRVDAPMPTQ